MRWSSIPVLLAAIMPLLGACARTSPAPASRPAAADVTPDPIARPLGSKVFPLAAASALDHPGRDGWQRPDEVMAALEITPGMRVADVGAGTGYFTIRLAAAVGTTGRVLAADIQQPMLDLIGARLTPEQSQVVWLRRSDPVHPLEAGDRLDLVLCANTLHEVDDGDQQAFVASLFLGLAPGGRLAMINWRVDGGKLGPPQANRIAPERVKELAAAAGFRLERELTLLPTHSFQIYRKA